MRKKQTEENYCYLSPLIQVVDVHAEEGFAISNDIDEAEINDMEVDVW